MGTRTGGILTVTEGITRVAACGSLAGGSGGGVAVCPAPLTVGLVLAVGCAEMVPAGVDGAATVAGGWVAVGTAETPQAIPAAKTQAPRETNHRLRLALPRLPNRVT
ncbi:MAG: hypothetical protein IIC96_09005 [Chloroflexi bacterium]|nr:hypothetical protein [Chloroflexota bacterium]